MPITINSKPDNNISIRDCTRYELIATSLINGNISLRVGYQLMKEGGESITQIEALTPKESTPFFLDFKNDLIKTISTKLPNMMIDKTTDYEETEFIVRYNLRVWEIIHDSNTCETTTGSVISHFLNSVFNSGILLDFNVPQLLSTKPHTQRVNREYKDIFTFYKPISSDATIQYIRVEDDGSETIFSTINAKNGVHTYTCSLAFAADTYGDYSETNRFKVKVGGFSWEYIISCNEPGETIVFQTRRGGYSSLFMIAENKQIRTESLTASVNDLGCLPSASNGITTIRNRARNFYDLFLTIPNNHHEFYDEFLSSGSFFIFIDNILYRFINNNRFIKKYTINDDPIITLKGNINHDIALPNYYL